MGPYILKENQYPAIIINPARISASKDLAFISKPQNQKIVAENILKGIENYALNNFIAEATNTSPAADTIPAKEIASYEVIKKNGMVIITYTDRSKKILNKEEAQKMGFVFPPIPKVTPSPPTLATIKNLPSNPLYILNGKEVDKETIERIGPSNIASISVLKENNAVTLYGEKGRQGVIEIITKDVNGKQNVNIYPPDSSLKIRRVVGTKNSDITSNNETAAPSKNPERVFTKVEQPASFPGGVAKWVQYIQKAIMENINDFDDEDYGTCIVKFIVDENGNVSNVEATTMKGTHLARTAVNAIQRGPNWVPATQNGHKVNAYTLQPVTLTNPKVTGDNIPGKMLEKMQQTTGSTQPNKVFTKVELEAAFPGGPAKWAQYIRTKISENIKDLGDQDYGTCVVKFIVNEEGKVSEVEATTMKGTSLAKVAVDAIRKGPNWVPAVQNGHKVNAYRLQPVTLTKPAKEITSKLFPETK
jgi:outer membrane biosynthesis protein TonB